MPAPPAGAEAAERAREDRLRRVIARRGFKLERSRQRRAPEHGHYRIVDPTTNIIVAGSRPWDFSMTLDAVEEWANELSLGTSRHLLVR